MAVLDHGKSGGVFVDQSENILELEKRALQEGYESIDAPMQGMIVNFDVNRGYKSGKENSWNHGSYENGT